MNIYFLKKSSEIIFTNPLSLLKF